MNERPESMHRNPEDFPRRILLAVTGLSPQIVTETLYGLVTKEPPFVPTEIHIISTQEGAERAQLELISQHPGWFHQLCNDYSLPPITFTQENIHVLRNKQGEMLSDIRSPQENQAAADFISEQVRILTADNKAALHVSLAGGRKTMGFFLGYALSLFGRPQDRLSHVLVSEHYESSPDFFYPTPQSQVIYTRSQKPLDSKDARITLAEIPFVPLRPSLGEQLLKDKSSYNQAVEASAKVFETPQIRIQVSAGRLFCGGERIGLTQTQMAVYCWFAEKRQQDQTINPQDPSNPTELLDWFAHLHGNAGGHYDGMETALKNGMDTEYLRPHLSKIRAKLNRVLGKLVAEKYAIRSSGKKNHLRYALAGIEAAQIELV